MKNNKTQIKSRRFQPNRNAKGMFTKGSGGFLELKSINWGRFLPVILVVGLVGGFLIYRTNASFNIGSCQRFEERCLKESHESTVVRMYYVTLNRAPSEADIIYWTGRLQGSNGSKLSTAQIANFFINSQEFKKLHPQASTAVQRSTTANSKSFAEAIYSQTYPTSVSSQIIDATSSQITSRKLTPAAFIAKVVESSSAKQALINKVAVVLGVKKMPTCLTKQGTYVDIATAQNNQYRNVTLSEGSVINATTASWNGKKADGSPITWATILDGGSNSCWYGGRFFGTWDDRSPDVTWENPYHHSAGMVIRANNFMVEGLRVDNQGDGISMEKHAKDFRIKNVYLSNIHDDCIQNDGFNSGVVEGSLFDGCYAGFSAASKNGNGSANTWKIENNLLRMKPFHTIYKPEKYVARGCKIPSHTTLFKGWTSQNPGPKVILKNNIFRADEKSCIGTLTIPTNMNLTECSNNTMVWLGKGPFPYTLPGCIKLTTDKKVWDNAVAQWKKNNPSIGW